jgi:lysozyme family protein
MRAALDNLSDKRFAAAMRFCMPHEGGFVNDPDDPGGATNWGVSLAYLRRLEPDLGRELGDVDGDGELTPEDMRQLPAERAVEIYHRQWWTPQRYDELPVSVAVKVFDLAINMGPRQAHKILQRACRASGSDAIADDGILGPVTVRTVMDRREGALMPAIRSEAAGFYRGLVAADSTRRKFINGWLARAYA